MSDRLAAAFTVVEALAESLLETGSSASDVRLASLVIVPGVKRRILISTPAVPWSAIVPSAQVTVPAASEQLPWVGVADTNVTPAGSVSVSVTPAASAGPELLALSA